MKARRRCYRWLCGVLVLVVGCAAALTPPAPSEYRDPAGRYRVPVPDGWAVTVDEDVIGLIGPGGDVTMTILLLAHDDARSTWCRPPLWRTPGSRGWRCRRRPATGWAG